MTIDVGAVPEALASVLTISEFAAGILLSIFVTAIIVICVAIFTQKPIVLTIFTFLGLGLNVGLGWLEYYFLFIVAFIVALMYAFGITKMLGGS